MDEQNKALAKAWELFDSGNYQDAEALYLECYDRINISDSENVKVVLMGLIYTEAFLEKYDEARKYGNTLLKAARNESERHVAIHQLGMIERMGGDYAKAMELFIEEESIIHVSFPDDYWRMSANFYEQGYVALKMKQYEKAENLMLISLEYAVNSKDDMCMGCAYRGLGEIMAAVGKSEKAMDCFEKAISSFANAGDWMAVEEIKSNLP